jgi:hypothetical protein
VTYQSVIAYLVDRRIVCAAETEYPKSRRMSSMAHLSEEIAKYEKLQADLEAEHLGKWVVIHDSRLEGIFNSFDAAAESAVERFGRGPYLIRQIGAPPVTLPASVMYRPVYA